MTFESPYNIPSYKGNRQYPYMGVHYYPYMGIKSTKPIDKVYEADLLSVPL